MILLLATSGPQAEVGLLAPTGAVDREPLGSGAARGRGLLPAVAGLLHRAGRAATDVEGIVVDRGPGSFTGVRVGVTTAKTLAFALAVPVAAVTSLEALARASIVPGPVVALRDAGRRTWYAARFGPRGPDGDRDALGPPERVAADALDADGETTWLHEAETPLPPCLAGALTLCTGYGVEALADLGRRRLADGGTPAHDLAPLYLQASAPEQRLGAG